MARPRCISAGLVVGLGLLAALAASACIHVDDQQLSTVQYYHPCEDDWECPSHTACYVVTVDYLAGSATDMLCTKSCVVDSQCPDDGACRRLSSGPQLCFEPCWDDLDCPWGFACVEDPGHESTCLPW